jgi:ribosomal-protein-alanine N-acetyltransferase
MTASRTLRPLGALDLDLAAALHRDAFASLGETAWLRRDFAELLASPGVAGVLLEVQGRAVGFALWRRAADEAELLTLAVNPIHRRCGAGRCLVQTVVKRAREAGARQLFLEVGSDNRAARALYDGVGFITVGRRAAYYRRASGPAADAVVMRLALG